MLTTNCTLGKACYNAVLFLLIISCSDNGVTPDSINSVNDNIGKKSSASRTIGLVFDGAEGDVINLDTARKWIDHYIARENRIESSFFSAKALNLLMTQETCIGIRFYYSESEDGGQHLFAKGTDNAGNDLETALILTGENSSVSLDEVKSDIKVIGTELDSISNEVFYNWTKTYSNKRPGEIRAHFFGYEIIRKLLSYKDCVGLRCYYALNKNEGEAKIILVGVSESGLNLIPSSNLGGRISEEGPFLADFSYPCPTLCSGN